MLKGYVAFGVTALPAYQLQKEINLSLMVSWPRPAQLCRNAFFVVRRYQSSLQCTSYVPVVVVGAGPTGLVLSSLLSQYGIQHALLEKGAGLTQHPQAHYINNRTMEVFRSIQGLSQQVNSLSPPLEQWRRFIYCESLVAGQLLGEVDHFPGQTSPCNEAVSPEPVAHVSQHKLAQLLLQAAQHQSAAHGHCAAIHFSSPVTSVSLVSFHQHSQQQWQQRTLEQQQQQQRQQAAEAASAIINAAGTGLDPAHVADEAAHIYPVCVAVGDGSHQQQQQQQLIRCSYLVAADGSHSTIRHLLGIQMSGRAGMQHLISIHFSWPELGQALLKSGRAAMLYFVFNPEVVAVLVAHNLDTGEFVAQVPYFPPLQSPGQFTPDLCKQLVAAAAGFSLQHVQSGSAQAPTSAAAAAAPGTLQLHTVRSWTMSAEVAEEYAAWDNRALLAGDAAHRFPPAGGFGMNTGVQDAHNLAWKLAAVLSGKADPALLSSYQLERRPVAVANANLSINNWHEAIKVPQALGLDPAAATLVNRVMSNAPLPQPLAQWLLESALATGRNLASAVVPLRKAALQGILASGQSLRLQFPNEDLGFVYQQGAVAAGPAQRGQQQQKVMAGADSLPGRQRDSNVYEPSVEVGGRLPHCWLQLLKEDGQLHKVSTLDLVTPAELGLHALLLCSSSGSKDISVSCHRWLSAGQALQSRGWPLKLLCLLPASTCLKSAANEYRGCVSDANSSAQSSPSIKVSALQSLLLAEDCMGMWSQLQQEIPGCQAMLVRPDGHIAWRQLNGVAASGSSDDSVGANAMQLTLQKVLQEVLHLRPSSSSN